ncbi:hypothetical protein P692DRAFT_20883978, partial [Suillus brevipes Sb2]
KDPLGQTSTRIRGLLRATYHIFFSIDPLTIPHLHRQLTDTQIDPRLQGRTGPSAPPAVASSTPLAALISSIPPTALVTYVSPALVPSTPPAVTPSTPLTALISSTPPTALITYVPPALRCACLPARFLCNVVFSL